MEHFKYAIIPATLIALKLVLIIVIVALTVASKKKGTDKIEALRDGLREVSPTLNKLVRVVAVDTGEDEIDGPMDSECATVPSTDLISNIKKIDNEFHKSDSELSINESGSSSEHSGSRSE